MDVEVIARVVEHGQRGQRTAIALIGVAAVIGASALVIHETTTLGHERDQAIQGRLIALHDSHDAASQSLGNLNLFSSSAALALNTDVQIKIRSRDPATRSIGIAELRAAERLFPKLQTKREIANNPKLPLFARQALSSTPADTNTLNARSIRAGLRSQELERSAGRATTSLSFVAISTALLALSAVAFPNRGRLVILSIGGVTLILAAWSLVIAAFA